MWEIIPSNVPRLYSASGLLFNERLSFFQLMNSELAALQEKLEDTVQRKEKIDQFLINSKGIFRQQVRLIAQNTEVLARFCHKISVVDVLFRIVWRSTPDSLYCRGQRGRRRQSQSPPFHVCFVHPLPRFGACSARKTRPKFQLSSLYSSWLLQYSREGMVWNSSKEKDELISEVFADCSYKSRLFKPNKYYITVVRTHLMHFARVTFCFLFHHRVRCLAASKWQSTTSQKSANGSEEHL